MFGTSARGLNIEATLYSPSADYWAYVQVLYEYGVQGEQVLSAPAANFQTFRLNIYQTYGDTAALEAQGIEVDTSRVNTFIFDAVKLACYSLYFGYQNFVDIRQLISLNCIGATGGQYFQIVWNGLINYFNLINFIYFIMLTRSFGTVNEVLRGTEYIDSNLMANMYQEAQLFDTLLVLMNMLMILQFTAVSRRVSVLLGLVAKTGVYLMFLVVLYIMMLFLMALIVWQVWGDRLSYFRSIQFSIMYTFALFDLKSMYLAKDFMSANQYGVDAAWLFVLVILFALVLHYSITLQYSAFFHIYWNIAKKYEKKIHSKSHAQLKDRGVFRKWLMGIFNNPFKKAGDDEEEEEAEGGDAAVRNTKQLRSIQN